MGPLLAEVAADELGALAINFFYQLRGFLFGFSQGHDATDFFFVGGEDEGVESVGAIAEDVGGAAADDDAITAGGRFPRRTRRRIMEWGRAKLKE